MTTKIILNRENEWRNRARGFKVWIDGKEVGTIANGGSEAYLVEPGTYKLQCKIDWCSSPGLELTVKEGETRFVQVGSGMKYYSLFTVLMVLVLLSGPVIKYLKLKVPEEFTYLQMVVLVPFLLYYLYYLSIGRSRYLLLKEDSANVFR
ncbi:MAG: hypothetical protein HYU71_01020 [Bacteroidetes bacterium]|nr:hypothetical protein [Bacteroidota bacterium]